MDSKLVTHARLSYNFVMRREKSSILAMNSQVRWCSDGCQSEEMNSFVGRNGGLPWKKNLTEALHQNCAT